MLPRISRETFGHHEAQRLIDVCLSPKLLKVDTIATGTRIAAENMLIKCSTLLAIDFFERQTVDKIFASRRNVRNTNTIVDLEAELPESVITKSLNAIGVQANTNETVTYAHRVLESMLGVQVRSSTPTF
ncbi:Anhydro-N-acetylmuramic acid kinase [Pyrenophora seminiperda CCB06]|uniref:Anhydro-N-acetylmuramic acid kinase n=1 Tax=Pyrenophora seminiperda CCB06 TaxID=1302712 RepID=A0A3M7M7X7_9PLEO|nr:Anhydro-N-acetylmuramic acid kinase [Pyrenophora seminiperda CCB06]